MKNTRSASCSFCQPVSGRSMRPHSPRSILPRSPGPPASQRASEPRTPSRSYALPDSSSHLAASPHSVSGVPPPHSHASRCTLAVGTASLDPRLFVAVGQLTRSRSRSEIRTPQRAIAGRIPSRLSVVAGTLSHSAHPRLDTLPVVTAGRIPPRSSFASTSRFLTHS